MSRVKEPLREITSARFVLKELTATNANTRYLSWLMDEDTAQFIHYIQADIDELAHYIEQRYQDEDCWFFGIFYQGEHIGNIKYQRLAAKASVATMGILIGEKNWRGKGVASEVLEASLQYLKNNLAIKEVNLGVEKSNKAAIKAYEKIGFSITNSKQAGYFDFPEKSLEMIKQLS